MSGEAATTAARASQGIDLGPLFAPRSIAVVGASARGGIAATLRNNLLVTGSETRCHFVNPRYTELGGEPCYPSIAALPERPDVVLVALNPLRAAAATLEAAQAGVPAVVIPGGGVVEGGEAAAQMQAEVAAIARDHGIALVGPNCMGVWDLTTNSSVYIGDVSPYIRRGGVAGIAQSGSVTDAFIHSGSRIGFSRIVSCGSEVVLDVCDYLAWCLDDPDTRAVILFLEGFKRPERFLALADRALELGKPIFCVKVGRSPQAQAAAVAHSGSLAGETRVTDAALDAVGVQRFGDLDELLEAGALVEGCRRTGRGVGRARTTAVTVSTGEASLIADLAPRTRVDLPSIPVETVAAIATALPTMSYIGNPLDPWGAADASIAYRAAFDALAASGAYDVLAIVHDFPYRSLPSEVAVAADVTRALIAATRDRPDILPVYVSLTSGEPPPQTVGLLEAEGGGMPILRGAVEAFTAIAALGRWEAARAARAVAGARRPAWPAIAAARTSWGFDASPAAARSGDTKTLNEAASLEMLAAHGLPVTAFARAATPDAAVAVATALGFPVAVKLDAEGVGHKTEIGGVRLALPDPESVAAAARDLLRLAVAGAKPRGVVVQPMAPAGVELIVGARRDPQFGVVVLVGFGGVVAEALDDVAIRLAPVTLAEAREMLGALRGSAVLGPFRGRAAVDLDAVARIVVAAGDLVLARPAILELDLNPVIAAANGATIVDALVVEVR
ncbi:MAG TPA: acetate--CoA ligase family protein [Candidatus Limnocylindrales bacterium]|nr:acetate--CoA ligase family protein [Candidatus Limnocylindrales bacterium]